MGRLRCVRSHTVKILLSAKTDKPKGLTNLIPIWTSHLCTQRMRNYPGMRAVASSSPRVEFPQCCSAVPAQLLAWTHIPTPPGAPAQPFIRGLHRLSGSLIWGDDFCSGCICHCTVWQMHWQSQSPARCLWQTGFAVEREISPCCRFLRKRGFILQCRRHLSHCKHRPGDPSWEFMETSSFGADPSWSRLSCSWAGIYFISFKSETGGGKAWTPGWVPPLPTPKQSGHSSLGRSRDPPHGDSATAQMATGQYFTCI